METNTQTIIDFMASRTRRDILKLFLAPQGGSGHYYQREIAYLTGRRLYSIQRELKKLVGTGLLIMQECRGRIYYSVNRGFSLLTELKALFG